MTSSSTLVPVFNAINAVVVPLVRAGFANPPVMGSGIVVLEVPGRRSGQLRTTPLTCVALGRQLIVATVRDRSQWIRNLAAARSAQVWWGGKRFATRAEVFQPHAGARDVSGTSSATDQASAMAGLLREVACRTGVSIAVLHLEGRCSPCCGG